MESDANAIQICVRVRPWHPEKEQPFVVQPAQQAFFLGDGNFAMSPRRPTTSGSLREVVEVMDHRQLDFDKPEPGSETRRGQPGAKRYKNRRYIFDHVFQRNATQEAVFEKTAKPLLSGVLDGFNATVFAYGATGCGKTHTISGTAEDPGITVRIMRELFEMIEESKDDFDTYVELSMVEIYNENIRDLLGDNFPACPTGGLKLLENEKERVTVDGVTLKRPASADEVMALVLLGNQRRSTSYTESNAVSSRSHAVLQINVGRNSKGHEVDFEQAVVRQCTSSATLSIIDLAGSERASATRNMGTRMKEGANINKSLLALSSCISALCQRPIGGRRPHVPYRNSKLTRMLKFSLGGNCRTVMIVCVSPSSKDIEDTHNTLVWADKAKNVSTKITRNTAGVQVSVQQYLTTISQQEARIRYLESKVEEGTMALSMYAKKKLESARQDARAVLDHLRKEFEKAIPTIIEGAKQRALWDQAEMKNVALKGRMAVLQPEDEEERTRLNEMVEKITNTFSGNSSVQAMVQDESVKSKALDALFRSTASRSFGDAIEPPEQDAFKLKVRVMELELAAAVSAAREKGYREGAQQFAEQFSAMISLLASTSSTIRAQTQALRELPTEDSPGLAAVIAQLDDLLQSLETGRKSIFATNKTSQYTLPALPKPKAFTLPPPRVSMTGQASRRRFSMAPAAPLRSALRPRRLSGAPMGTPSRKSLPSQADSPAKRSSRPFKVGQVKNRTPKKSFRWKDEAGEGEIDDIKTAPIAPRFSSSGEDASLQADASIGSSDEWRDEPDDSDSAPPIQKIVPAATIPPISGLIGPPVPAWKRAKLGVSSLGNLTSLDEARESSSSPEPASKKGLGPPARSTNRPPLNARHQVPAITSPSISTMSNLLRPTIASRSRSSINVRSQSEIDGKNVLGSPARRVVSNGRMQPPLSASKAKRRNSKGPYMSKSERLTSRTPLDASLGTSSSGLPVSLTVDKHHIDGVPSISVSDENRRSSMMPTVSWSMRSLSGNLGAPSGPRASLAVPSLPRGPSLTSKPSLTRLNAMGNSTRDAGDTSRAAWR
ncbi:P-loop containing nucleoside triphosphate hydrolase protein [Kockovaella imperatae]|uniref:p-loop containing nucleoside triphosphate hydrolase protein n=1 Tax=Kockovaella imperatae TaxID=4999 RepID=A0A1Y1UGP2_9TREE|nr:P-loop containing nucleoside triphosphate hydrolase protein [Kockovaella imperatae]ORX36676.1 P-loop containing nucleoside triphosphate hydrolase protein [Kockovaella imperatae]